MPDFWRGMCLYCDFATKECAVLEIAERLLLAHARQAHKEITQPDFEYVRRDLIGGRGQNAQ